MLSKAFIFNEKKATEAAGFLLKMEKGKMNYMKLIKLLYLADRKSINLYGTPIIGDMYCAMKNGPVLSTILDLITDEVDETNLTYWTKYIKRTNYDVELNCEVGDGELSKRNETILSQIFEEFKEYDEWKIVNYCHTYLQEWKDTYKGYGSPEIQPKKIYEVLDIDPNILEYKQSEKELFQNTKELFAL